MDTSGKDFISELNEIKDINSDRFAELLVYLDLQIQRMSETGIVGLENLYTMYGIE